MSASGVEIRIELTSGPQSRRLLRQELEAEGVDFEVREPIEKRDVGEVVEPRST